MGLLIQEMMTFKVDCFCATYISYYIKQITLKSWNEILFPALVRMCLFKLTVLLAFFKCYNGRLKGPSWKNTPPKLIWLSSENSCSGCPHSAWADSSGHFEREKWKPCNSTTKEWLINLTSLPVDVDFFFWLRVSLFFLIIFGHFYGHWC